jgi:putative flippase GtrA
MLDIGINYIISSIVSFIISVMFAFVTNRRYVFKANLSFFKDMIKFYFARVFTLIFNIVALILAVQVFKFDEFISQIFLTVIIITVNYILSKWIIFK